VKPPATLQSIETASGRVREAVPGAVRRPHPWRGSAIADWPEAHERARTGWVSEHGDSAAFPASRFMQEHARAQRLPLDDKQADVLASLSERMVEFHESRQIALDATLIMDAVAPSAMEDIDASTFRELPGQGSFYIQFGVDHQVMIGGRPVEGVYGTHDGSGVRGVLHGPTEPCSAKGNRVADESELADLRLARYESAPGGMALTTVGCRREEVIAALAVLWQILHLQAASLRGEANRKLVSACQADDAELARAARDPRLRRSLQAAGAILLWRIERPQALDQVDTALLPPPSAPLHAWRGDAYPGLRGLGEADATAAIQKRLAAVIGRSIKRIDPDVARMAQIGAFYQDMARLGPLRVLHCHGQVDMILNVDVRGVVEENSLPWRTLTYISLGRDHSLRDGHIGRCVEGIYVFAMPKFATMPTQLHYFAHFDSDHKDPWRKPNAVADIKDVRALTRTPIGACSDGAFVAEAGRSKNGLLDANVATFLDNVHVGLAKGLIATTPDVVSAVPRWLAATAVDNAVVRQKLVNLGHPFVERLVVDSEAVGRLRKVNDDASSAVRLLEPPRRTGPFLYHPHRGPLLLKPPIASDSVLSRRAQSLETIRQITRIAGNHVFDAEPIAPVLLQTDVDGIRGDDLQLPFERFYLHLGRHASLADASGRSVEGVYVASRRSEGNPFIDLVAHFEDRRPNARLDAPVLIRSEKDIVAAGADALAMRIEDDRAIQDGANDTERNDAPKSELCSRLVRIVANVLVFMAVKSEDKEPGYHASAPRALLAARAAGKSKAQRQLVAQGIHEVRFVGRRFAAEMERVAALVPTGQSTSPHHRRAHWKRVAHGPQRSQRRWTWIAATLVNARLGQAPSKVFALYPR